MSDENLFILKMTFKQLKYLFSLVPGTILGHSVLSQFIMPYGD